MSRISLLEKLYVKKKPAAEFDYDSLIAPPIASLLSYDDLTRLTKLATSNRYNANTQYKRDAINEVMEYRGFEFAAAGTNRLVYNYKGLNTFVAKVAFDRDGMQDQPREWVNQFCLKPFCTKVFEISPTGAVGFFEKVNPIISLAEFMSIAGDVFNMMMYFARKGYVTEDMGATKFMNYGLRYMANGCTFGPVVIDFPRVYKLDMGKTKCRKPINTPFGVSLCNGDIDWTEGLDEFVCTKCGKIYTARDIGNPINGDMIYNGRKEIKVFPGKVAIVNKEGEIIMQNQLNSNNLITQNQFNHIGLDTSGILKTGVKIKKIYKSKRKSPIQIYEEQKRETKKQLEQMQKAIMSYQPQTPEPVEPQRDDFVYSNGTTCPIKFNIQHKPQVQEPEPAPEPVVDKLEEAKQIINEFCMREYDHEADFSDMTAVEIAYTDWLNEESGIEHPVQIIVDLEDYSFFTCVDEEVIDEEKHDSLQELIDGRLNMLSFDEITSLPDEVMEDLKKHDAAKQQKPDVVDEIPEPLVESNEGLTTAEPEQVEEPTTRKGKFQVDDDKVFDADRKVTYHKFKQGEQYEGGVPEDEMIPELKLQQQVSTNLTRVDKVADAQESLQITSPLEVDTMKYKSNVDLKQQRMVDEFFEKEAKDINRGRKKNKRNKKKK